MSDLFRVYASEFVSVVDADSPDAVIAQHGPLLLRLSISQAREFSNQLARAADDAELKLKD